MCNLSFKNLLGFYQGTFDKADNFYVTGQYQTGTHLVGVIRGGCSAKALTILSTANEISASWGIQVTPTGKIAVADQENPTIYTYDPPVKDALGTPIATTPLTGVEDPAQFAFMKSGAYLFVAAEASNKALKFAYPAGGNALKSIGGRHMDGPVGVVVTPGAQQ